MQTGEESHDHREHGVFPGDLLACAGGATLLHREEIPFTTFTSPLTEHYRIVDEVVLCKGRSKGGREEEGGCYSSSSPSLQVL